MGTRTTKMLFEQVTSEEVTKLFKPLGFVEIEPGVFDRQCGKVVHGFGFSRNPSFTHFNVEVGANVPALDERLDYGRGVHCSTLLVSRPLGLLQRDGQGRRTFYHFATVEELRNTFPRVYTDFVEQAEPWLAELATVEDVAREFHKWRIAPPSAGTTRRPDPYAWAIYGWLLQKSGNELEGRPWLQRAYEYLQQPVHMKQGRLVPRTTTGSKAIPLTAEDNRMMELLKRDLSVQ